MTTSTQPEIDSRLLDAIESAVSKALRTLQPPTQQKLGYTFKSAGEALGVDPQVIRRLHDSGQIAAKRVGKRWIVPRSELERLLGNGP